MTGKVPVFLMIISCCWNVLAEEKNEPLLLEDRFNLAEGTVEFQECLQWPEKGRVFYEPFKLFGKSEDGMENSLVISHKGIRAGRDKEILVRINQGQKTSERIPVRELYVFCPGWVSGQRHKITLSYRFSGPEPERFMRLYLDEALQDQIIGLPFEVSDLGRDMTIGRTTAAGAVDGLRIYSRPKIYPDYKKGNLIANPGFELDENGDGCPDYYDGFGVPGFCWWGPAKKKEENGINTWCALESFSGKYSAKMQGFKENTGGQIIVRFWGVRENTRYEFDAALKSNRWNVDVQICAYDYSGKQSGSKPFRVGIPETRLNQWVVISDLLRKGENFYKTPPRTRSIAIYLFCKGASAIYWDDLFFGEKEETK